MPGESRCADEVPEMCLRTMLAGDIPPAPAFRERRAMRDFFRIGATHDFAAAIGPQRSDKMPRHAQRSAGDVTLEAVLISRERGLLLLGLLERVEDGAELRV